MGRLARLSAQISRIDAEIKTLQVDARLLGHNRGALKARIHSLRVARNELVYINQLPADVFIEIIRWVCIRASRAINIAPITRVCHGWREIAINCPAVWSYIGMSNLHGVKTWLHRSGSMPLTVHLGSYYVKGFKRLLDHSHRIGDLLLYPERYGQSKALPLYTDFWESVKFPSIRRLFLSSFRLPDKFLPSITSPIESLTLVSCTFDFRAFLPAVSTLTSLTLAFIHPKICVDQFVAQLRAMSGLKTLVLRQSLRHRKGSSDDDGITLPDLPLSLSELWMHEAIDVQRRLIAQKGFIRRCTTASLLFYNNDGPAYAPHLERLLDLAHSRITGEGRREITEVCLHSAMHEGASVPLVLLYQPVSPDESEDLTDVGEIEVVITCHDTRVPNILENTVDLSHVRLFRMGTIVLKYGVSPVDNGEGFLEKMKNVRCVHIGKNMHSYLDFLKHSPLGRSGGDGALDTLRIASDTCDALFKELPLTPDQVPRPIGTLLIDRQAKGAVKELKRYAEKVVVGRGKALEALDTPLSEDYYEVSQPPYEVYDGYGWVRTNHHELL